MDKKEIPRKVDLGCGKNKSEGWLGVDFEETEDADIVMDLDSDDWSELPENHFEKIRSDQVFEHVKRPFNFFNNIHKIAKDGAEVITITPHASSQAWQAPDHQRLVSIGFPRGYLEKDSGSNYRLDEGVEFRIKEIRLLFSKRKLFPWNYIVEPLINLNFWTKYFFEQTFLSRILPAQSIYFKAEVLKQS